GYYARAAQRTGRAGDFFTSVDVGPVFGELLEKQFAEMRRILQNKSRIPNPESRLQRFDLVEGGAGNGRLSRDILDAAQRTDSDFYEAIRLAHVERSPAARAAQAATLDGHAARLHHSGATRSLKQGFLIIIDYGHEEGELYGASHAAGTLATFRGHVSPAAQSSGTVSAGWLQEPGTCDITAHVDLSAVRRAAEREGLNL